MGKKLLSFIFSSLLVLCLLSQNLSALIITNDGATSKNSKIALNKDYIQEVNGKVNKNLSTDSAETMEGVENANLTIENISLAQQKFNLKGTVSSNNGRESYQLHIDGEIYQSKIRDDRVVIKANDTFENFEIIYASISQNPDSRELKIISETDNRSVMQLYLLKKDTRELYMFETELEEVKTATQNFVKYDNDDYMIEHWWMLLFEPTVEFIDEEPLHENPIGIQSTPTPNVRRTTVLVSYSDYSMHYMMDVLIESSTNSFGSMHQVTDTWLLTIADQRQYENGIIVGYEDILLVQNTVVTMTLRDYVRPVGRDQVINMTWGTATNYSPQTVSFSLSLSYGPASISFTPTSYKYSDSGHNTFQSQTKAYRLRFPTALKRTGNQYSISFTKQKLSSTQGSYTYQTRQYVDYDVSFDIGLVNHHTRIGNRSRSSSSVYY